MNQIILHIEIKSWLLILANMLRDRNVTHVANED